MAFCTVVTIASQVQPILCRLFRRNWRNRLRCCSPFGLDPEPDNSENVNGHELPYQSPEDAKFVVKQQGYAPERYRPDPEDQDANNHRAGAPQFVKPHSGREPGRYPKQI